VSIQKAQLSLTNCPMLVCKVVEVLSGLFVRIRRQEVHVHMLQTVN